MQNNANSRKAQQHRNSSQDTPKWESARVANANNTIVNAVVDSVATKDGRPRGLNVTLQLGEGLTLPSFIPGSEIPKGVSQKGLAEQKATIEVKVIEVNRRKGRLISSLSTVVDEKRNGFLSSLAEEQEVTGTVARKTDFGYFVEIGDGAVDALLHVSQTALVDGKPEVLEIGQTITARIRSVNAEEGKVALTMRKPRPEQKNRIERFQTRTSRVGRDRILALPKSAPTSTPKKKDSGPRKLNPKKKDGFEVVFTSEGGNPFEQLAKHMAAKNGGEQAPVTTDAAPAVATADAQ